MSIFVERQAVKKRNDWAKRFRQAERVLLSLAVVFAGLAAMYGLYRIVFFGDSFAVKKITVEGQWKHLDADGIAALSGVVLEDNLFWLSTDDVYERLKEEPWIKTAVVRRRPPDTLWIYAEEYRPAAIISADEMLYVDINGDVFKVPEAGDDMDYPVFTGLGLGGERSLSEKNRGIVNAMFEILDAFDGSGLGKKLSVSEVHYDQRFGYSILTGGERMQIFLGYSACRDALERAGAMFERVKSHPGRIQYMLADEPGRLVVKYHAS
jgi:hypothetical protein